jgi:hypothetical protein
MSDGGRESASHGVKMLKSSQEWSVQRFAVRSIARLGVSFNLREVSIVRSAEGGR